MSIGNSLILIFFFCKCTTRTEHIQSHCCDTIKLPPSTKVQKVIDFLQNEMGVTKIRFPQTSGIGIKPVSQEGTVRLVRAAIQYAIDNDKDSVTLVHKGNIMKFTEGI